MLVHTVVHHCIPSPSLHEWFVRLTSVRSDNRQHTAPLHGYRNYCSNCEPKLHYETKSTLRQIETIQSHHHTLDNATTTKQVLDAVLRRRERQIAHVHRCGILQSIQLILKTRKVGPVVFRSRALRNSIQRCHRTFICRVGYSRGKRLLVSGSKQDVSYCSLMIICSYSLCRYGLS